MQKKQNVNKTVQQFEEQYGCKSFEIDGLQIHQVSFWNFLDFLNGMTDYVQNGFTVHVETVEAFPRVVVGAYHLQFEKRIAPSSKKPAEVTNTVVQEVPVIPEHIAKQDADAQKMLDENRASKDPSEKEALAIKRGRPAKVG
jgi:hypothetical protein